MKTSRLEAFSDGVIAILITIMVLELKVPHGHDLASLRPLLPIFGAYVLSFIYLGIYWNNHHHLFQVGSRVSGSVLWANLHLLFWLSLVPFTTSWADENGFAPLPVAMYGVVLLMCGVAYSLLVRRMIATDGPGSPVARAIGRDSKGWISMAAYAIAVGLAFVLPWLAGTIYIGVALMWLIPDRRLEKTQAQSKGEAT